MTNKTFRQFLVPLLFQTVLILAVPAQAVYTLLIGKSVILQTAPVDPYDLLRSYSQIMRYEISSQDTLRDLPGWEELPKQQPYGNDVTFIKPGTRFYVILAAPVSSNPSELPHSWEPMALSLKRPSKLPPNRVALQGLAQRGLIQYGLETYYIPEDQRKQINADLRGTRQAPFSQPQQLPPILMEIKVDAWGHALPIGLWAQVGNAANRQIRNYPF
ncbi:MAG TPA: membrane-anchored protein [Cyanobacteria bacterium UBA8803]|nr:membrane-anchored protein [Cyanobacteria bacterium UBA9273]HBL59615.1 membrane-anchored protein [Cyanobacteria bacterium UBA8803]